MAAPVLHRFHFLGLVALTHACRYSASDPATSLPPGHPDVSRRRAEDDGSLHAPDAIVPDAAGGRFAIPGGGITVARPGYGGLTTVDLLDTLAKRSKGPLCYWSWQSLPPPPDAELFHYWPRRGAFDFPAMETKHNGSVAAIRDLCSYAVDRLQAHVDPVNHTGVVVNAAVSEGTEFGSFLCRQGLHLDREAHPERCAPGAPLYTQTWGLRWPMSVTMWMFDGTNKDEVTRTMKAWRAEASQHLPNILSPGPSPPSPPPSTDAPVSIPPPEPDTPVPEGGGSWPRAGTGWGVGGGVVGKALPCDAIPEAFRYQPPFPQDTSPAGYVSKTGKTYLEDALEYWSTTPGVPLPSAHASPTEPVEVI